MNYRRTWDLNRIIHKNKVLLVKKENNECHHHKGFG